MVFHCLTHWGCCVDLLLLERPSVVLAVEGSSCLISEIHSGLQVKVIIPSHGSNNSYIYKRIQRENYAFPQEITARNKMYFWLF